MSRYPVKTKIHDEIDQDDGVGRQREVEIATEARAIFGDQASTAVAFCGLDAWFDGQKTETRRWANILRRLRH